MAVDQESLQPVGEQTADNQPRLDRGQIKQDTPHRLNRRSFIVGSMLAGVAALASKQDSQPHLDLSKTVSRRGGLAGFIDRFLKPKSAEAAGENTGVGQDYTATYIYPSGNKATWQLETGTHGRADLGNNPNILIDTIKITNSTDPLTPIEIQPNGILLPADTSRITVYGHWVDTNLNIGYAPITISRNHFGIKEFPYLLIFLDSKNAGDKAKQMLISGLPQGGTIGDAFSFFRVETADIKFTLQNSVNSNDNGSYMFKKGTDGLPIGAPMKIESVMSRRVFLPIIANQTSGR